MAGLYRLEYIQLTSTLSFQPEKQSAKWRISPKCKAGGGCDLNIHSISGKYDAKAAFVNGKYRFSRKVPRSYTCGSGGNVDYYITEIRTIFLTVKKMILDGDQWIATKLEGIEDDDGTRGCGLQEAGHTRYAVRFTRAG